MPLPKGSVFRHISTGIALVAGDVLHSIISICDVTGTADQRGHSARLGRWAQILSHPRLQETG